MGWPCMEQQNPLLRTMIEQNPVWKRQLGRPSKRWEDAIKQDVEEMGRDSDWRNLTLDREEAHTNWKLVCETGWS